MNNEVNVENLRYSVERQRRKYAASDLAGELVVDAAEMFAARAPATPAELAAYRESLAHHMRYFLALLEKD